MIVKVQTWIYLDVIDTDQAEQACMALSNLDSVIRPGFPHGEPIEADVDHFEVCTAEEIGERGLEEE
jgi:uncharacterized protein YqfB (UPF0267 family)